MAKDKSASQQRRRVLIGAWALMIPSVAAAMAAADDHSAVRPPILQVRACEDFEVTGRGDADAWQEVEWTPLARRDGGKLDYASRFKMLYSPTGVYVLFNGEDRRVTATMTEDFMDLWNEDVFECFFWTDERDPVYFEYEISPLGRELPILVPNLDGRFLGWRPWRYVGDRRTRKAATADGKPAQSGAAASQWTAEAFIPYTLLEPLRNTPPSSGTKWRANFYRVDYDDNQSTGWDWARVGPSFHEHRKFGTIEFE